MSNTSSSSSANQPCPSNKGKEKVTYDDEMNKGKAKGILIKEPDHHYYNSSSDDDHDGLMDPNNNDGSAAFAVAAEESSDDSTEEGEPSPDNSVTAGGNRNSPRVYNCSYCEKSFASPQALGGHQNSHKMERLYQSQTNNTNGNGIQFLNNVGMGGVGMGLGMNPSPSSFMPPTSPTIPPFRPFFGGGANSLHHYQPMNMMMGNNNLEINNSIYPYHHGLVQNNAARPSNLFRPVPVRAGIAYPHAGSGSGSGALGVENIIGAFQPNIAYPHAGSGSGAVGIGEFQRPYGFQSRGASEHPHPPRPPMAAAAGIRRIREDDDESGGVNKRPRLNEACDETQHGEFKFVLLPSAARNNDDTKVEIDFGLVPKRDGDGN
ncbi:hypothetical protein PIB30_060598 [Stylosanthes scabra]|uniref:C2H2-type domain-containing protein n=1 Tax=Stylosanthes scabra TaxID=79078 RepID=A0ABU6RKX1_9FABA|nr:hypothetical protein [Stylosanthes scabra]